MDSIREQLGTVIVAAIFAVLIWLWAEGENRESDAISLDVTFVANSSEQRYMVRARAAEEDPPTRTMAVRVEVEGPHASLQRLRTDPESLKVYVDDPSTAMDREREIDLLSALQNSPQLRDKGISITNVTPPRVLVRVDEVVRRNVPIQQTLPNLDLESIRITPPTVPVDVAKQTLEQFILERYGESFVVLSIPDADLARLKPGEPTTFKSVAVKLIDDLNLQLDITQTRDSVSIVDRYVDDVTLTLRGISSEETTLLVPVNVSTPAADESNYDVVLEQTHYLISDVIISGDVEKIRRVRNRQLTVVAQVTLTSDDLEQGITSKRVEWIFSDPADSSGLTVRVKDRPVGERPEIQFRIVRRSSGSTTDPE